MQYRKIPLSVEAVFSTDGKLKPCRLFVAGKSYDIDRITGVRRHRPRGIPCIAPIEYSVVICGIEKLLYYEGDSGTWFSVREVLP